MLRKIVAVALCCWASLAWAQKPVELPVHQLHADSLAFDLRTLCSPRMAGRGTGQAGFEQAAQYVGNRLAAWGWQAFGENEDPKGAERYFLQVPYRREQLLGANLRIGKKRFSYRKDYFVYANGMSGKYAADSVVFVGYGRENAKGAVVFDTTALRGKWVIVLPGSLKENGEWQASFWREAYRQMSNAGVAGMFLAEPQYAKESKAMLERLEEERISLNLGADAATPARGPITVVMREKAFGKLMDSMGWKLKKQLVEAKNPRFKPQSKAAQLALQIDRKSELFQAPNVAAFLPGESEANEWLIVSAHLDHLGTHHGKVFQGADDNGSGSAALLSLARQMAAWRDAGLTTRRNVFLVWFSGEENGLLGSRYFADHLPMPVEQVIANVNVDMIGRFDDRHDDTTSRYIYVIGADRISQDLHDWHEAVNERCCKLELDYTFNAADDPNRYYFRSDHYNFAKKGIPSMFYFSGVHADYHKEGDTVDKINFGRMAYITELILYNCWNLANQIERPKPNK